MELNDKRLKLTRKRIESLNELGIFSSEDLVTYYPSRYDILNTKPFDQWLEKDKVSFQCEVVSNVKIFSFRKNQSVANFDVLAYDRIIHVTIYNRPWARSLMMNQVITVTGIYNGKAKVTAMNYVLKPINELDAVTPVYSIKNGMQQKTLRDCIAKALEVERENHSDRMPIEFLRAYRLLPQMNALRMVHQPNNQEEIQAAYRTLKYHEFLEFFTAVQLMKNENGSDAYKTPRRIDHEKVNALIHSLPYTLTSDQAKAVEDILNDMESNHLMYRLIQGDVGCGKTLVALIALFACTLSGYQGALLAPTEILARQHYQSMCELLKDFPVKIAVLYSGAKAKEKQQILEDLENGEIQIIIGTHSLIQESVKFSSLGLVVADEQQRFGVEQRKALREKGEKVDFLLMSATPIPRTLAATFYGDMEISTIETMPPGRKPVLTQLILENSFRSILPEVESLLAEGRQLYVICAAVEKNEDFVARAVEDVTKSVQKLFASRYQVGMLHGRMSSEEKQTIMQQFSENELQILVSTTVVEVGMNVVNATGMIIYDADRFGLSQLHQLRGRVQRGSEQGQCWLLTSSKDNDVKERLNVLVKSSNGFEISYEDLRLRGPGDILGTRQSGTPDFILGNLIEDTKMIAQARIDAAKIVNDQENPDYIELLDYVREKNARNATYVD